MGLFGFGKHNDEYDFIYSDSDRTGNCPYCDGKDTMSYDGSTCYICSNCNTATDKETYLEWLHGSPIEFDGDYVGDPSYEEIYDESGNNAGVRCIYCNTEIRWKDGQYICPNCGEVMSRSEFFNAIGAEPPGPERIDRNNLYPGCIICPYGYVKE